MEELLLSRQIYIGAPVYQLRESLTHPPPIKYFSSERSVKGRPKFTWVSSWQRRDEICAGSLSPAQIHNCQRFQQKHGRSISLKCKCSCLMRRKLPHEWGHDSYAKLPDFLPSLLRVTNLTRKHVKCLPASLMFMLASSRRFSGYKKRNNSLVFLWMVNIVTATCVTVTVQN